MHTDVCSLRSAPLLVYTAFLYIRFDQIQEPVQRIQQIGLPGAHQQVPDFRQIDALVDDRIRHRVGQFAPRLRLGIMKCPQRLNKQLGILDLALEHACHERLLATVFRRLVTGLLFVVLTWRAVCCLLCVGC